MNVIELKEKRKAKYDELDALIKKVEQEKRDYSDEEKTKRDTLLAELNSLDSEIKAAEELERRKLIMAGDAYNKANDQQIKRELKDYNLAKAIFEFVQRGQPSGLELEIHQDACRRGAATNNPVIGLGITNDVPLFKRDIVAGSSTTVGSVPMGFFDALYAKMVFGPQGFNSTFLKGLSGNITLPGITTGHTPQVASSENAQITEDTSMAVQGPSLSPKRIGGYVEVSKQLIAQANQSVADLITNSILRAIMAKLESQVINGAGSSGELRGILNTSGIGSVVGGTNGAAIAWSHVIGLEKAVAAANADLGNLGYLTNPNVRYKLKMVEKNSTGTLGNFIWENSDTPLNGYKALITTNVPSTLTKGTSTGVCSAIIFGNFADLVIAQWGDILDVELDKYTKGEYALIRILANGWFDCGVLRAGSFAAMTDALTT